MHFLDNRQRNSNIEEEPPNYRNNGIQVRLNRIEKFYNSVEGLYSRMNIKDAHKYHLREAYRNLEGKKEEMEKKIRKLSHHDLDVIMAELNYNVESAINSMKKKRLRKKAGKAFKLYRSIIDNLNPGFSVSIDEELGKRETRPYEERDIKNDG